MAKYGPFKKKMDWRGKLVRLPRQVETNGGSVYPEGTIFEVVDTNGSKYGYKLQGPACEACGHLRILRVESHTELELVENAEKVMPIGKQLELAKDLLRRCAPSVREAASMRVPGEKRRFEFDRWQKGYDLLMGIEKLMGTP